MEFAKLIFPTEPTKGKGREGKGRENWNTINGNSGNKGSAKKGKTGAYFCRTKMPLNAGR